MESQVDPCLCDSAWVLLMEVSGEEEEVLDSRSESVGMRLRATGRGREEGCWCD